MGYSSEDKKLDAEVLQKYIYGGHVAEYMEWLQEENGDKYNTHFAKALGEGLDADSIEDMYKEVRCPEGTAWNGYLSTRCSCIAATELHRGDCAGTAKREGVVPQAHAAIRADPTFVKKERAKPAEKRSWKQKKLTYDERKANLKVTTLGTSACRHSGVL